MHILFLSHYFAPEVNAPATRTYEHCREWVKAGHRVTVLSYVPHHPMGKAYPGYRNRLFQSEEKDGIRAIKLLTYITANEGFLKRTFNYVFYMVMAIVAARFLPRADVVISTSSQFFNGLAGYFVSRLKRCPWILEIRDLWPESILAVGAIRNRRVIAVLGWVERFVYRKADHIVSVTHAFREHILARGGSGERITVIRNGVDLALFTPRERDEDFAGEIGVAGKFVASYVGTHGMAHGLDTILDAADLLRDRDDIAFLLVGDGAERARLEDKVRAMRLPNVRMLGQQPKAMMPAIWAVSDVSLVLLRKLDLFKTVIPSKIFESMAMKRPIILGVEGESQMIIEEAKTGICIEPENARQLADSLQYLASDPDEYRKMQECGYRYVREQFDRSVLARRYLEVLENNARR